jgi:dimethylargininase
MLTAITREVSPRIQDCALTFLNREPIDLQKAVEQHRRYKEFLEKMGVNVISLPPEPDLPDSVFVEDTAVIVEEVAVIARMGLAKRRAETRVISSVLAHHRPRKFLKPGATLDGGDCIRIGRRIYVGNSSRTNQEGIAALRQILAPYDYEVRPVEVAGCLHLSTGCSYLGKNTMLVNREWINAGAFEGFEIIDVPKAESWAAAALRMNGIVLLPGGFPRTQAAIEERGFQIRLIDISEFQKAEGGLSCLSLIFRNNS